MKELIVDRIHFSLKLGKLGVSSEEGLSCSAQLAIHILIFNGFAQTGARAFKSFLRAN